MADTTTTLNPGVGGDVMDESQATQASGTVAKRPRVVIGNDVGQLVDAQQIIDVLSAMLLEQRRQTTLLQMLLSNTTQVSPDLDELDQMRTT